MSNRSNSHLPPAFEHQLTHLKDLNSQLIEEEHSHPPIHLDSYSLHWHDLNKPKFLSALTTTAFCIRLGLYPAALVKTRMQVLSKQIGNLSFSQSLGTIVRTHGVRGLYRGFPINIIGLSMDPVFITTLETVRTQLTHLQKEYSQHPHYRYLLTEGAVSMVAGASGAVAAQTVLVPVDIITQKLQIDKNTKTRQIVSEIVRNDGVLRGMYKGYALTILATTPYNALVWSFYWKIQNFAKKYFQENPLPNALKENGRLKSDWREIVMAPVSSCIAATLASLATQPADVLKTRIQVQEKRTPITNTIRKLVEQKGWRGFMAGSLARVMVVMPGSVIMMSCYEAIKRNCVREDVVRSLPSLA